MMLVGLIQGGGEMNKDGHSIEAKCFKLVEWQL